MSRTGPARPNLTAQLQEKLRTDREQIEALTTTELKQLAESLSKSSKAALDAMERDTHARLARMRSDMEEIATRQRRWPLWTALSCIGIAGALFAMLWMATSWARSDLKTVLTERYEARQVLDELNDHTRGISMQEDSKGQRYVVAPEGSENRICSGVPCIRLPKE